MVFQKSEPSASNYAKQQLAGRLLARIAPMAELDIKTSLRSVLPAYDPSVEQLPQYFAKVAGLAPVVESLKQLQAELGEGRAGASAKTMRWWLEDPSLER